MFPSKEVTFHFIFVTVTCLVTAWNQLQLIRTKRKLGDSVPISSNEDVRICPDHRNNKKGFCELYPPPDLISDKCL